MMIIDLNGDLNGDLNVGLNEWIGERVKEGREWVMIAKSII